MTDTEKPISEKKADSQFDRSSYMTWTSLNVLFLSPVSSSREN